MYGVYRGDDGEPFILPSVKEVCFSEYFPWSEKYNFYLHTRKNDRCMSETNGVSE